MKRFFTVPALGLFVLLVGLAGCGRDLSIGQPPELSPTLAGNEVFAMSSRPMPSEPGPVARAQGGPGSLWTAGRQSLLGDRRASRRGDILTVVIEIDESAEISNSTQRSRDGSESMGLTGLFGLPQRLDEHLPDGASMAEAVGTTSASRSSGDGSVRRNEQLTLRIAATVTDVLDSGALRLEGTQEVRVNAELRELIVTGYVRPEDISRQNEVAYDRIAAARISYGGRGVVSDVQQPRYGQQIADIILPF